jgi:hypothetical protein
LFSIALTDYLHISTTTEAEVTSTLIDVSSEGGLSSSGEGYDQRIVLNGVDAHSWGDLTGDQTELLQTLISDGKLKLDSAGLV